MDIDTWDNDLPSTVADDIFPANAFGPGIVNGRVIHEMFHYFRNRMRKPHVALARIVIVDTQGNQYVYAIPRVFVSGANHNNAIGRWNVPAYLVIYNNLNAAINPHQAIALPVFGLPPARPIDTIVKGIEDYDFMCNNRRQYQFFAHSERSAILGILYDQNYSMEQALTSFMAMPPQGNIAQIIVQIKIAHQNGVCENCRRFFNDIAAIMPNYEIPQIGIFRPRPISPACVFNNHIGGVPFPVRTYLLIAALQMGFNVPNINLRVSHRNGPNSIVNGF